MHMGRDDYEVLSLSVDFLIFLGRHGNGGGTLLVIALTQEEHFRFG